MRRRRSTGTRARRCRPGAVEHIACCIACCAAPAPAEPSETCGNFRPPRLRATVHPCLALPCLALPCLALPCLALPCLALPCLAVPCLARCGACSIVPNRSAAVSVCASAALWLGCGRMRVLAVSTRRALRYTAAHFGLFRVLSSLCRRAALLGDAKAQYKLGWCYESAHGCVQDEARPSHICTGTALTPATSAPGLRSRLPRLHRDCAHACHVCTGTASLRCRLWRSGGTGAQRGAATQRHSTSWAVRTAERVHAQAHASALSDARCAVLPSAHLCMRRGAADRPHSVQGSAVEGDGGKSITWWTKAAQQGHQLAQVRTPAVE
jgi:hypothetical protein